MSTFTRFQVFLSKELRQNWPFFFAMVVIAVFLAPAGSGLVQPQSTGASIADFLSMVIAILIGHQVIHSEFVGRSWQVVLTKPIAREYFLLGKFFSGLLGMTIAMALGGIALKWFLFHAPFPGAWSQIISFFVPTLPIDSWGKHVLDNTFFFSFGMMIGLWQPWSLKKFRQILVWIGFLIINLSIWYAGIFVRNSSVDYAWTFLFCIAALGASLGLIKELQIKE